MGVESGPASVLEGVVGTQKAPTPPDPLLLGCGLS